MKIKEVWKRTGDFDPAEYWDLLLEALRIREGRLDLPYYSPTETISKDPLAPGMRLELGSAVGSTTYPARISRYQDTGQGGLVEVELLFATGRARPWRTYCFTVGPDLRPNSATASLVLSHHYPLWKWPLMQVISLFGPSIADMSMGHINRSMQNISAMRKRERGE